MMTIAWGARVARAAVFGAALGLAGTPALADLGFDAEAFDAVDATRPEKDKTRDTFRNPKETLEFFEIGPKSSVLEVLPGGGWYTRILLPLVAEEGAYAATSYSIDMIKTAFPNVPEERLEARRSYGETFPAKAAEFMENAPEIKAWLIGDAPEDAKGTIDAVLFVRALHNMGRAGDEFMDQAIEEAFSLLKPGGIVGVVQHKAPEDASDEWAKGGAGYIKQSRVVARFEAAGFELDGESDVNANAKDQPTEDDIVWRLPPSLRGEDEAAKEANKAIGESNRMTLKFRKPAE